MTTDGVPPSDGSAPFLGDDWFVGHDFGFHFGGAERVTRALGRTVPADNGVVLAGDGTILRRMGWSTTTPLFPRLTEGTYRPASFLFPAMLARRTPLPGNLLASSYAYCHMVPAQGRTVVYCHSPLRQVWSGRDLYRSELPRLARPGFDAAARWVRAKDVAAARRSAIYVANSTAVQRRIGAFYGIPDVPVVFPPVDSTVFHRGDAPREDFYLFAGRVVEPYKRLALLIEAFAELPGRLVVAGDGRDRPRLEAAASSNVTFLGEVGSVQLGELYRQARALLFPSEDDFGMTPAEAIACGTPVIAFGAGGALDTVVDGASGLFFAEPSVASFGDALHAFEAQEWPAASVSAASRVLDEADFTRTLVELIGSTS